MGISYHRIIKIEGITKSDGTIVADNHKCNCGFQANGKDMMKHIAESNDD